MVKIVSTFDNLLLKGIRSGQIPNRTADARKWFRQNAKKVKTTPSSLIREDRDRLVSRTTLGKMYFFFYDPKHKKKLPYYDTFPCIFKIGNYKDGMLAINLHYLPLPLRAKLMDALYDLATNEKYDENTRLRITYDILKGASKYRFFKPCIKRYLNSHVKSKFISIEASEWDIALFLGTEAFEKANKQKVWRDTRDKISGL